SSMPSTSSNLVSAAWSWNASASTASGPGHSRQLARTSGSPGKEFARSKHALSENSARSRRASSSTYARSAASLGRVDGLHLAQACEAAERLELDLTDALSRHGAHPAR